MIEAILKFLMAIIDYYLGSQVASKLGYGHQIDSRKRLDKNTGFMHGFIYNLGGTLKIIEIGAGRGVMALELASFPNVEAYLACDIDPHGLSVLQKRSQSFLQGAKISVKQMNVHHPEIEQENYFDVMLTDKVLHLMSPEEIACIFDLAYKVLKPGGFFVISSVSKNNFVYERTEEGEQHPLYRKLKSDMLTRLWYNINRPYVFFITKEFIQQMCEEKGFQFRENLVCPDDTDYVTLAVCKMEKTSSQ